MLAIVNVPDVKQNLAIRFKERRLSLNLSQATLAQKSGVSLGSIKRFEQDSDISLSSLLKLSLVLECLDDFTKLCSNEFENTGSINELLKQRTLRRRGQR
jgi:transcriptional regulator with XRE-family HTH domain